MKTIRSTFPRIIFSILIFVTSLSAIHAQEVERRPLDHSVYDHWNRITGSMLSADGRWAAYTLAPQDGGDVTLMVKSLRSDAEFRIVQGSAARFTADSRYLICLIRPTEEENDQAEEEERKPDERPKSQLGILDLREGRIERIERVKSFRIPEDEGRWIAYLKEKPIESDESEEGGAEEEQQEPQQAEGEASDKKKEKSPGTDLILRNHNNGEETSFEWVTDYTFSKDGATLVVVTSTLPGDEDGIYAITTRSGDRTSMLTGDGNYRGVTISEEGERVAFLTDRDDFEADEAAWILYQWGRGTGEATVAASAGTAGIPSGWLISQYGSVSFSENGERLFFGTAPPLEKVPEMEEDSEESEVVLDIWHWQDTRLQPQQLLEADRDRRRNFQAVIHLDDGHIAQLANEEVPRVSVGSNGSAPLGLASTSVPYENPISWENPSLSDVYLVDIGTGERELVMEGIQARVSMSPGGKYLVWWDYRRQNWYAMDIENRKEIELSAGIPWPVHNEIHDTPMPASGWGNAGWTEDDGLFLIYDRYDIWATDPTGQSSPRCITEEMGRNEEIRFRYVQTDREADSIDPRSRVILSALDSSTKAAGFYRDRVQGSGAPEELLMDDFSFSNPTKADDADIFLLTRQSFTEFPDLWTSDSLFRNLEKVSRANPQQEEFLWGTAELVHWNSVDGTPLDGILYKPEGFDPSQKYPMMVTFYEKNSDNLHRHWMPEPHRSIINYTFYTSRGYLVFLPDIPYRTGYPGESALNAVVPGVNMLVAEGFVEAGNIGVAGHSWGGYQIAFMITRSNIFKAAEAGAPVSNMISAYGGIRWASGMSRTFQYEWTQSRIGATLWDAPLRYIENSPVFWADKIETPLLIMHNDEDGAVPWEQGIELFIALRRLQKPVWMITYNKQPHWPITWPNKKDWAVRLQQYFDHFLTGAPAPRWISEGVPALLKGKTLGREIPPGLQN